MKYSPTIAAAYFRTAGLPVVVPEYRFHPTRRWRFDFAWPFEQVALEVQGGIFVRGRHSRGAALLAEWVKLNTAATMGWRILYCQPRDLLTEQTVSLLRAALQSQVAK
jgi:hypothetical protein